MNNEKCELKIDQAVVFAAGRGERMRPITDTIPKPLIPILGKPLLEITINKLFQFGINKIFVNCCYRSDLIKQNITKISKAYPNKTIITIEENEALETGGTLISILPLLNHKPFFTINGDIFWIKNQDNFLLSLQNLLENKKLNISMLLCHQELFVHDNVKMDFSIDQYNRVIKNYNNNYCFTGIQLLDPKILVDYHKKIFSLSEIFHKLTLPDNSLDKVHAVKFNGKKMFHISTPEILEFTEYYLRQHNILNII